MRASHILAALIAATPGCSLALDTDGFRAATAPADAGPADREPWTPPEDGGDFDAGVVPIEVAEVAPDTVLEGLGAAGPEFRGAAVYLSGSGLDVDDVQAVDDDAVEVRAFASTADGTGLGIELAVFVDTALDDGQSKTARLELSRDGLRVRVEVTVEGLDERVIRAGEEALSALQPRPYSELRFEGGRLAGLIPHRWLATSLVEVLGPLDVEGKSDGTPGPGGCAGGAPEAAGGCEGRGGGRGLLAAGDRPAGGGGGGGFEAGEDGAAFDVDSSTPGGGGAAAAEEPIVGGVSAAAGGGGGGGGSVASAGGGGGGGGLVLASRGRLVLGDVDASGGPGAVLTGNQACDAAGGGGGGGGAVVLRAWRLEGQGEIDVRGGAGSEPACENRGGAGSPGFVYVQTSSSAMAPSTLPREILRRAPAWGPDTPVLLDRPVVRLPVVGAGNVFLQVVGGQGVRSSIGGAATVVVELDGPGLHEICLQRDADVIDALEGRDCLVFAYLP